MIWQGEQPVQGISPNHTFLRMADPAAGGEQVDFLLEAAANPRSDGSLLLADPGGQPISVLARAELAVRRPEIADIILDFDLVRGSRPIFRTTSRVVSRRSTHWAACRGDRSR